GDRGRFADGTDAGGLWRHHAHGRGHLSGHRGRHCRIGHAGICDFGLGRGRPAAAQPGLYQSGGAVAGGGAGGTVRAAGRGAGTQAGPEDAEICLRGISGAGRPEHAVEGAGRIRRVGGDGLTTEDRPHRPSPLNEGYWNVYFVPSSRSHWTLTLMAKLNSPASTGTGEPAAISARAYMGYGCGSLKPWVSEIETISSSVPPAASA